MFRTAPADQLWGACQERKRARGPSVCASMKSMACRLCALYSQSPYNSCSPPHSRNRPGRCHTAWCSCSTGTHRQIHTGRDPAEWAGRGPPRIGATCRNIRYDNPHRGAPPRNNSRSREAIVCHCVRHPGSEDACRTSACPCKACKQVCLICNAGTVLPLTRACQNSVSV